ncbi:Lob domain-containing protein [Thalictrum thalictroides]|uniref:Lob domain-containing protein n=1 Tax=Thalictrum thalictroides TaxID=46969 RepID=A0A7J6WM51_THATH|nr:Lob domain-containing protein [Thalictrum thalictroides]
MRANNNHNHNHNHGTQACAACKYQRRKCQPDCTLAPYFPPSHQTQFHNVHKLFGVSNILKIIRNLNTQFEKDEAMRSLIQEANNRAADPVGGSHRIVSCLEQQFAFFKSELDLVNNQLAICRAHVQQQMQINETRLHMMNMTVVPAGDDQQQYQEQQLLLVPYVGSDEDNLLNVQAASSSSSLHVQQNPPFLEMFDEPFLESIGEYRDRVKTEEEGEETGADEFLKEETKCVENAEGHDSKEVGLSSTLTD